ncbi:MAG TPA: MBL fold metallo-hydrolase [Acidimicrobiales bacterium]|nr:MBL fold metallo-hydrolase [Acidimicrobiales bacterium]
MPGDRARRTADVVDPGLDPGVPVSVAPGVIRVLAPNPGMMTGPGTNTYLVGEPGGDLLVIDPGPDDQGHLDAIVAAAGTGAIRWVTVTHTHLDHCPAAAPLKQRTGATIVGFETRPSFEPDVRIGDGDEIGPVRHRLVALHTPGHASDHLCFLSVGSGLLFSGDHVMNGSTVVVAPPDGDMAAYLHGILRLQSLDPPLVAIAPGHGPLVEDPAAKLADYLAHRTAREVAIHAALVASYDGATVDEIVTAVYVDVPAALHPVARFSVWAHLRKLADEGRATSSAADDIQSMWFAVDDARPTT